MRLVTDGSKCNVGAGNQPPANNPRPAVLLTAKSSSNPYEKFKKKSKFLLKGKVV